MSEQKKDLVNIEIDGKKLSVPKGTNVIHAAEKISVDIPHFCYHEGLTVAGQCRMCFVEVEGMRKLATACSTTVNEGMIIKTEATSKLVKEAQNNTLEFTLLNHPLDCPICDRGGECKLQDYTYEFGPPRSRMTDERRELDKHRSISHQIMLDQERCILCTRCVRFSDEVDGKAELVVDGRGSTNKIEVFDNNEMQSNFSGNVVDLCPVGALTAKDFRFQARPWELKKHSATCTGCSGGCSIEIHTKHRHNGIARPDGHPPIPEIKRIMPTKNLGVNDWWLCDKGRWGYHFHNQDENRFTQPLEKKGDAFESTTLKNIQNLFSKETKWEFILDDTLPLDGMNWAKELQKSWNSRGRNVAIANEENPVAKSFIDSYSKFTKLDWNMDKFNWSEITTVICDKSYQDLDVIAPMISLRIGKKVREEKIRWLTANPFNEKIDSKNINSTVLLLDPTTDNFISEFGKLSPKQKFIILWDKCNSRGFVNNNLSPINLFADKLNCQDKNVIVFRQSTNQEISKSFVNALKDCKNLIIIDSFKSTISEMANYILPLRALYETKSKFTNIENVDCESKGISIHHPNYPSIEKGGDMIPPSLKLL